MARRPPTPEELLAQKVWEDLLAANPGTTFPHEFGKEHVRAVMHNHWHKEHREAIEYLKNGGDPAKVVLEPDGGVTYPVA